MKQIIVITLLIAALTLRGITAALAEQPSKIESSSFVHKIPQELGHSRRLFGGDEVEEIDPCEAGRLLFGGDDEGETEIDVCECKRRRRELFGGDDEGETEIDDCECRRRRRKLFGGDDEGETEDDLCVNDEVDPYAEWKEYDFDLQYRIPLYTSPFSIIGSLWIIIEVLRDRKKRMHSYHRTVFALSIFDLIASIWVFSSKWIVSGLSHPACEANGFFIYWASLAIPLYNAALSTYFLLSIGKGWKEDDIREKFERIARVAVPLVTFAIALAPVFLDLFNTYYYYCFATYGGFRDGDERGTVVTSDVFLWIFWGTVMLVTCYVTSAFTVIYIRSLRVQREMVRRVKHMAFLYTLPFYATWGMTAIWQVLAAQAIKGNVTLDARETFVMQAWMAIFMPLQGFFNFLIYMIPRIQRIRSQQQELSCMGVICASLTRICAPRKKTSIQEENSGHEDSSAQYDDDSDNESMMGSIWEDERTEEEEEERADTVQDMEVQDAIFDDKKS
jgi:hypothetical protein